jgi:hypothetical protein
MLWTTASNMFFACFSLFITSLCWQNSYYLCSFWPFRRRSDGMSCSTMTFQSLCFDEYYHCILFNFVILQYKYTCFWFFSPIKFCFCLLLESFNFTLESTWCNTIMLGSPTVTFIFGILLFHPFRFLERATKWPKYSCPPLR